MHARPRFAFVLLVVVFALMLSALGVAAADGPVKAGAGDGAQLPSTISLNVPPMGGSFSEGFEDITTLPGMGWAFQNNSSPLGLTDWFQGNDTVFPAQAGSTTSYIGANFNNTSGTGTISNWMMTPAVTLEAGDTIKFWTQTVPGSIYPDRLEVRMSLNGSSTNVGATATSVGDFTTVLAEINPTLVQGGYPETWTEYTITLTAAQVPAPTQGRVAFRYFVTNGGPSGANSDYIGIDTFSYTGTPPTAVTLSGVSAVAGGSLLPLLALASGALAAGYAVVRRRA